jgi:uncharacterized protein YqeY
MSINEKILSDLKEATKARDETKVSCLRMLKAAIKNRQIEKGSGLEEAEVQSVISSAIKRGKEAAEAFSKGGRSDLADKEQAEIEILYQYLPKQLNRNEIEETLKEIISELSATGPKDVGKVMKVAMAKMAGRAQGKTVNEIAKKILS